MNMIRDGKLTDPIIVWNKTILDGHNRYNILRKHSYIEYEIKEMEFSSRQEALIWICNHQLGRRNLTPERRKYLIGKRYETEKQVTQTNAVKSPTDSLKATTLVYTVEEIAQMLSISLRSAYNLCNSTTEFRVLRVGGSIRIPKDSFDAWLRAA